MLIELFCYRSYFSCSINNVASTWRVFPNKEQNIDYQALHKVNMLCVNDRVKQLRLNHVYNIVHGNAPHYMCCLLYTSPSPRDLSTSRMPSSA